MRIAATVARILLGLIFVAAGASGFFLINHPPPMPGMAGEFQNIFFASRWVLMVDGIEVVAGVLLLANRYVPLALVVLAAVIANILTFHVTMMPAGLPPALIVTALWVIVALPLREHFSPLFVRRAN